MSEHKSGDVTDERFTVTEYPMLVVWGLKDQGFAFVPTGWPKSAERAAILGYAARAVEAEAPCSERVSREISGAIGMLRHEFDLRPEDCAEDVSGWALASSILAGLIERAYERNHNGKP